MRVIHFSFSFSGDHIHPRPIKVHRALKKEAPFEKKKKNIPTKKPEKCLDTANMPMMASVMVSMVRKKLGTFINALTERNDPKTVHDQPLLNQIQCCVGCLEIRNFVLKKEFTGFKR